MNDTVKHFMKYKRMKARNGFLLKILRWLQSKEEKFIRPVEKQGQVENCAIRKTAKGIEYIGVPETERPKVDFTLRNIIQHF